MSKLVLSKIRINLRDEALKSPVLDAPRFANHFNKMIWEIWENFSNNKKV